MKNSPMCNLCHLKYKMMLRLNEGILAKFRSARLEKKKFTIISNNCWGGYIYRCFNSAYQSPTVGLFIMLKDYIKFISNLEYYIKKCKLTFIKPEESHNYKELLGHEKFGEYPIGKLDDVEICFMHYKTEKEALEKWTRRCKRIAWDNIIIKFCDQNGCTKKQIDDFNSIDKCKKMICFTAKKIPGKYNIYMREFKKDGYVVDDKYCIFQHLNITKLINE
ncbi:DUF1919 domain-containing protein [Candidatus Saccharibacteria bacterium]|nr:DUF1919 domain-containing protein [Candidatus Saccharibacteria bacterium]